MEMNKVDASKHCDHKARNVEQKKAQQRSHALKAVCFKNCRKHSLALEPNLLRTEFGEHRRNAASLPPAGSYVQHPYR